MVDEEYDVKSVAHTEKHVPDKESEKQIDTSMKQIDTSIIF